MAGGIFEDVFLTYKDEEYKIPSDRVMMLIAAIEQHVRIQDLIGDKGPTMSALACAYGSALRFAGARVGDDEIYADFFKENSAAAVSTMVADLLSMMVPPTTHTPKKQKASGKKK